jgi:hypothetical protein
LFRERQIFETEIIPEAEPFQADKDLHVAVSNVSTDLMPD